MTINMTTIKTSSDGAWQGDNPFNFAFPLLIVQTILVLSVSRFLAFLLKPLRQPKVIAEILGGILLGPSAIGRNKDFMHWVFPSWSTPILESVASIGLLFFLFLVGLELDLRCIRRSGKQALSIALAGIFLPFLFGVGVTFLLQKVIHFNGYIQHLTFMGVSLSITAFPVLARILAELKLLTTQVGETAMAAAAFNDVAAWILLALAVALAGGGNKVPLISIWVLISGAAFVVFMLLAVRPMMGWVARQCSREHEVLDEACICVTLGGVLVSGFVTDLIGIHSIFGGFVFGLTIPKGGEFAGRVTKRIEDFVSSLLLPLYFASSGLKTDVGKMKSVEAWGLLVVIISTASAGKIFGTFLVGMMCMIPARESLALGVLMNTKGLVELIVLNIGREKKVLNDEMFTILVLMALFTTFMTTPTVMAIYKPSRAVASKISHRHKARRLPPLSNMQEDLRVLACIHGPGNIPPLINFIESIRANTRSQLKLYVMHLVELTDRSSSILMVQRNRKNGFPLINRFRRGPMHDLIASAFQAYGQVGQITVHHLTAISALSTMHEDICHIAESKRIAIIILPFHMRWRGDDEDAIENIGQGWREVNQRVLQYAPCPVSVLVHRCGSLGRRPESGTQASTIWAVKRVCLLFTGGPDGRKVLELGNRMAEHPLIKLSLVSFVGDSRSNRNLPASSSDEETEKELDEAAMGDFRTKWHGKVEVIEKNESNMTEEVLEIGKGMEYELVIVGKSQQCCVGSTMAAKLKDSQMEHAELGPIGGLLSSVGEGITCSVLVVQDPDLADSNETSLKKVARERRSVITDAITAIDSSV